MTSKTIWTWAGIGCVAASLGGAAVGCSAGTTSDIGDEGTGSGGSSGTGFTTGSGSNCAVDGSLDNDNDGYTGNAGDCNDCDANVNPGATEIVTAEGGQPVDEDCDGQVDVATACDTGLAIGDTDAMNAARAIGLCTQSNGTTAGVVSAAYVRANGQPTTPGLGAGLVPNFGVVMPRSGATMLALSSGYARDASQGGCGSQGCDTSGGGNAPPGFPQNVPNCPQGTDINDDIALELTIKAPTNVQSFTYDFKFHSFEFDEFVCTSYNDQYVALMSPPPAGSLNGNISFDSLTNPVSVNVAFFDVCSTCDEFGSNCEYEAILDPSVTCPAAPTPCCPSGPAELSGTGFDGSWGEDGGATTWLLTTAPVTPGGNFTIRFAIWDTGDSDYDSTVLIDNFRWSGQPGDVGTVEVPE